MNVIRQKFAKMTEVKRKNEFSLKVLLNLTSANKIALDCSSLEALKKTMIFVNKRDQECVICCVTVSCCRSLHYMSQPASYLPPCGQTGVGSSRKTSLAFSRTSKCRH